MKLTINESNILLDILENKMNMAQRLWFEDAITKNNDGTISIVAAYEKQLYDLICSTRAPKEDQP